MTFHDFTVKPRGVYARPVFRFAKYFCYKFDVDLFRRIKVLVLFIRTIFVHFLEIFN